jgi:enamine deaminase RidA (YjgF/YER057c/UK114 family)
VNLLVQAKAATGDLDRVKRVVKLTGFVNCDGSFTQQHLVINGASALLGEVFGDAGKHSRSAVGSSSLPLGVVVEIEGIFEIA